MRLLQLPVDHSESVRRDRPGERKIGCEASDSLGAEVSGRRRLGSILKRGLYVLLPALILPLVGSSVAPADVSQVNDSYLAGYAAAVLEREFQRASDSVHVQGGVLTIRAEDLVGTDREQIIAALSRIRGIIRVEVLEPSAPASRGTLIPAQASVAQPPRSAAVESALSPDLGFLPFGLLFRPVLADPRWPHFSAAYRYYIDDAELDHVGAANFGETFALYRDAVPFGGYWDVGIQAGVFSIFDLNSDSKDLVNADYFVGLPLSYRLDRFSALLRVSHQSSHLGDEFLLRNRVQRINLSYENVDLKLSYDLFDWLRLYGGGGYLFNQEPSDLRPWTTQYGVEIASPWTVIGRATRPLVAADFQNNEEDRWSTNFSVRAGLQFENLRIVERRLQLLFEYFKGHSPNGQFYDRKIETIGLGLHLHY